MSLPMSPAPREVLEIFDAPEVALAKLRFEQVTMDQLREIFDSSFGALQQLVASGQADVDIPAVGIYYGNPMEVFDLEVAATLNAPLAAPIAIADQVITPGALPGGTYGALSHVGPYDTLGQTWARLMEGVAALGHQPGIPFAEIYLDDPRTTAPQQLRTELIVKLGSPEQPSAD